MLTKIAQIAVKVEAVEGTAETLAGADVFLAYNPSFEPNIEPAERAPVRAVHSPHPSVFGKRSGKMKFSCELVGGTAGAAVHFAAALKACGVAETLVASTSATYKPATASVPSVTIAMYMDGKVDKIWGARGTFTLRAEQGKPIMLDFEFTGADFSEADAALLTTGVSYHSALPPVCQGLTLTIDSYAALISKFQIAQNATPTLRPDLNAPSGHKSAVITGRKPTFTFDPENVLVATKDLLGAWRAGTLLAFTTGAIGSTVGNRITITAPKVQYQGVSLAERDGVSNYEINALLCLNTGDDEWQILIN